MKKKYPKEPGIILRRMRENQGLTIKQASGEIGISAPGISSIKHLFVAGQKYPTLEMGSSWCNRNA